VTSFTKLGRTSGVPSPAHVEPWDVSLLFVISKCIVISFIGRAPYLARDARVKSNIYICRDGS